MNNICKYYTYPLRLLKKADGNIHSSGFLKILNTVKHTNWALTGLNIGIDACDISILKNQNWLHWNFPGHHPVVRMLLDHRTSTCR